MTFTYREYYSAATKFALALIRFGCTERKTVAVLSYNCPKWAFAFHGAVMANMVSCGVYITNKAQACHYVLEHSDSEVCCVENQEHLDKVLSVWP